MMTIPNSSGIINAKIGFYNGRKCVFTHRNPKNGMVYSDDIKKMLCKDGTVLCGDFVPAEKVDWKGEKQ